MEDLFTLSDEVPAIYSNFKPQTCIPIKDHYKFYSGYLAFSPNSTYVKGLYEAGSIDAPVVGFSLMDAAINNSISTVNFGGDLDDAYTGSLNAVNINSYKWFFNAKDLQYG